MHAGSCECQKIQFEFESDFILTLCHCTICQKLHGSAFAPLLHTQADGFRWKRGEEQLAYYNSSEHTRRAFCSGCGSPMPIVNPAFNHAAIPASCMDTPVEAEPSAHFFTASKPAWFVIGDGADQFDSVPPGGVGAYLAGIIQASK